MKKGDDKWDGPYKILNVYPRACRLDLPDRTRVFPVFHTSLLRPVATNDDGIRISLPGQDAINESESKNIKGRILERDDATNETITKWEFEGLLDCHNEDGLHYLVKWRHQAASWQPAADLRGNDKVLLDFHAKHPTKPDPPSWVKKARALLAPTRPRHSARLSARLRATGFSTPGRNCFQAIRGRIVVWGGYCHDTIHACT